MIKKVLFHALIVLIISIVSSAGAFAETITTTSPNGKTTVSLSVGEKIAYSVVYNGKRVLEGSKLGLTFRDAKPFGTAKIITSETSSIDKTWSQVCGKQTQYIDKCTETTVYVEEKEEPCRKLTYVFRVYDEGVAFRYLIPKDSGFADKDGVFCVESEETEFAFGKDYDIWATFYSKFNNSQEEEFTKTKLSSIKPDSIVGSPLVVKGDGFYAALTEADLLNWAGAQFGSAGVNSSTVRVRLTPRADKQGAVIRQEGAASPWRVVFCGETAVDLVNNSDIIMNVASPNVLGDVSWVKSGNSSWNWWAPKDGYPTDKVIKGLIDFAAEMHWQYTLIDAGWLDAKKADGGNHELAYTKDLNLPEIVKYAESKNVRICVWFHHNVLKKLGERKALKQVADWGVVGVKIDFMDSQEQETVKWIEDVCKIAAEYKLLVDYHGMYKPTGMERTYPNQITREGVRGNEYNRWSKQTSTHMATLPFTRCMLGPADYTPGGFQNEHSETFKSLNSYKDKSEDCHVVGTRAHELALCMLYDSPLRCICDLPRNYSGQEGLAFLQDLPATWDKTIALEGEVGEFYVAARKANDCWYVSGITNEKERSFSISLNFLDDGEYEGTIYADSEQTDGDAKIIAVSKRTFRKGDVFDVTAVRDGGWNVVLKKK